ncbi:MAG: hypothetical protein AAF927_23795 [Bacteroidota bacterium]
MNGLLRWLILISLPILLWVIFSASKGSETSTKPDDPNLQPSTPVEIDL